MLFSLMILMLKINVKNKGSVSHEFFFSYTGALWDSKRKIKTGGGGGGNLREFFCVTIEQEHTRK